MSAITRKKVYSSFNSGLNDKVNPVLLKEDEAAELSNNEINERGILEKYKGYIKDGAPFPDDVDSFIRMLLNYKRGTSIDLLLMAALDDGNTNTNYKVDLKKTTGDGTYAYIGHTTGTANFTNGSMAVTGTGTSWLSHLKAGDKIKANAHADSVYAEISSVNTDTSITLTANYTGASTGGAVAYIARIILHKDFIPRGIVFNNNAIITNGSEAPMTFNNTTLDKITDADAPKGKFIEAHKNRVFIAGPSAAPSTVFWSAVNNELSWDATSVESVYPQDNGNIISLKSFGDSLIVLKNNGKGYQIIGNFDDSAVGTVDFIRRIDIPENIGIIAERSPVIHNGFLYFLAETGVYRIDQRMFVEKVSYKIDNFIKSLNFALGPTSSKTYIYDTKSQWDTGTHNGTRVLGADNKLKNYFDEFTITDCKQGQQTASIAIDSSNNIHVAYIDSSDNKKIKYKKYLALDNSLNLDETAYTDASENITSVALDVAPNGNIGILFQIRRNFPGNSAYYFVERTTSWQSRETAWAGNSDIGNDSDRNGLSFRYRTDNNSRAVVCRTPEASTNTGRGVEYLKRTSGVWSNSSIQNDWKTEWVTLELDGSNNPAVAMFNTFSAIDNPSTLRLYTSTNDGSSWSASGFDLTAAGFSWGTDAEQLEKGIQLVKTSASKYIVGYVDSSGSFKTRNFTDSTSATIDSATNCKFKGYLINSSDQNFTYHTLLSGSDRQEKYIFEASSNIQNSAVNNNTNSNWCGDRSFDNNGSVFASISFGANANELLVRRLAFRGIWTSPEQSDATLTAWGTYEVSGQVNNSATVTQEIALNTISPATSFNSITSGQVISSDAAKIFIKNRITNVLGAFATPEIDSIVDNYTGSGVDAKQPIGISFNNELFYGCALKTSSNNDKVLVLDISESFLKTTYPVSSLEFFKNKLYAGKSTNGDLLILRQGYNFAGSSYSSDFQSKEDFLEAIELEKDIYKFYILYEVKSAGTFTFSYRLDNFMSPTGAIWNDSTVDQTSDGVAEVLVGNKARSIQFRIQNTGLDQQLGIIAVVLVYGFLNIR